MKPIDTEKLISHSTGISNSHYRPIDNERLEYNLMVADLLTIDKQDNRQIELKKHQLMNQEETYAIN